MRWTLGVLAVVGVTLGGAVLVLVLARSGDPSIMELEAGECFVLDLDDGELEIEQVDQVSCDDPHDAEVVAVGQLNPDRDREYPEDDALFAEVDARCAGVLGAAADEFGLLPVVPNEASWEPLGGRFVCVAVPYGGDPVTGRVSPAGRT